MRLGIHCRYRVGKNVSELDVACWIGLAAVVGPEARGRIIQQSIEYDTTGLTGELQAFLQRSGQ